MSLAESGGSAAAGGRGPNGRGERVSEAPTEVRAKVRPEAWPEGLLVGQAPDRADCGFGQVEGVVVPRNPTAAIPSPLGATGALDSRLGVMGRPWPCGSILNLRKWGSDSSPMHRRKADPTDSSQVLDVRLGAGRLHLPIVPAAAPARVEVCARSRPGARPLATPADAVGQATPARCQSPFRDASSQFDPRPLKGWLMSGNLGWVRPRAESRPLPVLPGNWDLARVHTIRIPGEKTRAQRRTTFAT
jgi:hypothetical protein